MSRTPRSPAPSWKRGFFLFFSGQSLSLVGSALTQFVIMWWITQRTGSPRALAVAGIAGILPMAIVAPFAGVIVDRVPRKLALMPLENALMIDVVTAAADLRDALRFRPQHAGVHGHHARLFAYSHPRH